MTERTIHRLDPPAWFWKIALAGAAAIWGGSFVVLKDTLDAVTPAWLMAVRFLLAGLVLSVVFHRSLARNLDGSHVLAAAILGGIGGVAFTVQNVGLVYISPGRNAFLTAVYSVLVPFFTWALYRQRPATHNVAGALLAVAGVGFLSLGDDLSVSLGFGDWLTLLCAVLYALQITLGAHLLPAHDVRTVTALQMGFTGLSALVMALVTEPMPDFAVFVTGPVLASMAYLVLLSSCLCYVIQNVGQTKVPAADAGLLLSLESVFAVIASVIFYGEELTPRLVVGFALIFVAIVVSELGPTLVARIRSAAE